MFEQDIGKLIEVLICRSLRIQSGTVSASRWSPQTDLLFSTGPPPLTPPILLDPPSATAFKTSYLRYTQSNMITWHIQFSSTMSCIESFIPRPCSQHLICVCTIIFRGVQVVIYQLPLNLFKLAKLCCTIVWI